VLSKHRLNASSGHQDPPHILPHHRAVDSRLTGHAGKRWGGLEVSKTPARVVPGRKIRIKRNTNARSFLTSRPNLGMPPATYSHISLNITQSKGVRPQVATGKWGGGVSNPETTPEMQGNMEEPRLAEGANSCARSARMEGVDPLLRDLPEAPSSRSRRPTAF
jgi:hypothetical protein